MKLIRVLMKNKSQIEMNNKFKLVKN